MNCSDKDALGRMNDSDRGCFHFFGQVIVVLNSIKEIKISSKGVVISILIVLLFRCMRCVGQLFQNCYRCSQSLQVRLLNSLDSAYRSHGVLQECSAPHLRYHLVPDKMEEDPRNTRRMSYKSTEGGGKKSVASESGETE